MSGQKRNGSNNNDFLSSMTFAGGGLMRDCDCDECEFVPASIREAIRQHKRLKTNSSSLTRTQDRSIVARENTISVWKLTMPVDAEPLIEFGGSHRIVLIDTLSSHASLVSIGKGVIGSSDEEKSRKKVDWKEGSICLLPQNGGKALGWVHTKDGDSEELVGPAVMFSIKIPLEILEKKQEEIAAFPEWVQSVIAICRKNLQESVEASADNSPAPNASVKLDEDDAHRLRDLINALLENETAD